MPRGNPSPKLAITVDPDVHKSILATAAKEGLSLSAWMTEAARDALKIRAGVEAGKGARRVHPGRTERGAPACAGAIADAASDTAAAPGISRLVYDAGVLAAADRGDRRVWLEHKARLMERSVPLAPAPVVAQVSRFAQQAQLRQFLAGCHIAPLGESDAHAAGRLLGKSRTTDVVDASVVATWRI